MTVQIQRHITAPDGSYAHYPGQIIVDHEHAAQWVAGGAASVIGPLETADMKPAEAPEIELAEIAYDHVISRLDAILAAHPAKSDTDYSVIADKLVGYMYDRFGFNQANDSIDKTVLSEVTAVLRGES